MKNVIRQKAVRHLVSALLSGVFTEREVDDIARALIGRDDFTAEVGFIVKDISYQLSSRIRAARPDSLEDSDLEISSPPERAARLMKEAKLTQQDLLEIIGRITPDMARSLQRKRWPTARMLELFFRNQPRDKHGKLFKELARRAPPGTNTDPYLDLITGRLEG